MTTLAQPETHLFRGPPAFEARTPWSPLAAVLATILIVAVSILGAVLVLGAGKLADLHAGGPAASQDTLALATLGIWQAFTVLLTILAAFLFRGSPRDVLALRAPVASGSLIYLKALLLMFALQAIVSVVQHGIVNQDVFSDLRPMAKLLGGPEWLLALLVVGVGAPLSEELLFRGFLLTALARTRIGFAGAAVVSSGAWTALHLGYSTTGIVEVFLIGLYFSWLLWRTGSLRVAIFCHAIYNSFLVLLLRHVPLPAG